MHYDRAMLGATFLPVGQMLQLDRATTALGDYITAEMDISPEHWALPLHFPGDPVFPGCFLVEAAGQLVTLWAWEAGLRGRPRMAKASAEFRRPVYATDGTVTLRATVRRRRNMCFGTVDVLAAGRKVASIDTVIVVVTAE